MRAHGSPRVFWLCAFLIVLQPVVFVMVGALDHISQRGTVFIAVLLVGLARRSQVAWALLVLVSAIPLAAIGAIVGIASSSGSGHTLWSHVIAMVLTGAAIEAVLWSRPMRAYLGRRPRPGLLQTSS